MGVEALLFGSVLAAGIGATSAEDTQNANARSQEAMNRETIEFNREEGAISRGFNAQQAQLSREFLYSMSNSAHQREMADLRLAGLNPILAANSGASVSSAPVASSTPASVSGLSAYRKENVMSQFLNSALDGVRAANDLKKAQASEEEAKASMLNALTNSKRQVQDALESAERITNIKSDTRLKDFMSLSEEKQVELYQEKITSEIRERTDKHNLSEAQQEAVRITANAAATTANAQAHLADIRGKLESEQNPAKINSLRKQADFYDSEVKKNSWILSNPEEIQKRDWWKNNQGATGVKETAEIIGKVFHGGMFLPVK